MKNIKSFSGLCLLALIPVMFVVIAVSAAATGCDNDNICEAGENVLWCPNDCTVLASCGDGFCDANEQGNCAADCPPANCTPTNGGTEICDGVDNDCDGLIDEGLPLICKSEPVIAALYIPDTAAQSFKIMISNPNNNSLAIKWLDNGATAQTGNASYIFMATPTSGSPHTIKATVNNTVTAEYAEKEWQLNINTTYYRDADGDSYGNASNSVRAYAAPVGYVFDNTDCNDNNVAINPGAAEICDGVDNNCVGGIDEDVQTTYYRDADNDTYGDAGNSQLLCGASAGWVLDNTDCNDGNSAINPATIWYKDADNDLYSDGTTLTQCAQPASYKLSTQLTATSGDCNDANASIKPGAQEPFDSVDNDCDSQTDEATFWGQVTDSETGEPLPGKKLSFYEDTGIESKYSDPALLESYMYDTWQTLAPKATPDLMTDLNGYFYAELPEGTWNYVIQGSREDEMEVKLSGSSKRRDSEIARTKIVLPRAGYVKVYFEKASAALKSDLYMNDSSPILMVQNSEVGASYVTSGTYANGTELKFYISVNGTPWGLGVYNHWSESQYARVEQLDTDTWRIYFEDLPSNQADWDFNDAVVLVDLIDAQNPSIDLDCDNDGNPNYNDTDDPCDIGDNSSAKVDFNAEGHILYAGKYEKKNETDETNGNKYTCGQLVRFIMFGVNNGGTDETITFDVQDHTSEGGPNAPIIYTGNISEPSQSLTVLAGNKSEKYFDWQIPCPMAEGRYDIHVVWNSEVWHKIGNFFVVEDTTNPTINVWADNGTANFPNKTITVGYSAYDEPEEGTMPDIIMQIAGQVIGGAPDTSIIINISKDFVNNPTTTDISTFGGSGQQVNLTYSQSGNYTARFIATDLAGNSISKDINITVWITEAEAKAIAEPIYNSYGIPTGWPNLEFDVACQDGTNDIKLNCDVGREITAPQVLHEYIGETLTNPLGNYDENVTNVAGTNSSWMIKDGKDTILNGRVDTCGTAPYIKVIYPSGSNEYNQTLTNYLRHLKCDCFIALAGPAC